MTINGTDITTIRGDTESLTITCEDEDGVLRPFEEGDTVAMTIGWPAAKVLQKTVTAFTDDGAAIITLTHEDTDNILAGDYRYDVQLTTKTGVVKTIIPPSEFVLRGDVTRE